MVEKMNVPVHELYEILYDKTLGTVQLFDIDRKPILWTNGDDKWIASIQTLIAFRELLKIFGHNFQPLWDIDEGDYWIMTRMFPDGREKGINQRYVHPSDARVELPAHLTDLDLETDVDWD